MDVIISNRCFVAHDSVELVKQLTGVEVYDNSVWGNTWLNHEQRILCASKGANICYVGQLGLGTDGPDPEYDMVVNTMKLM